MSTVILCGGIGKRLREEAEYRLQSGIEIPTRISGMKEAAPVSL
jgi:hypothetical protein